MRLYFQSHNFASYFLVVSLLFVFSFSISFAQNEIPVFGSCKGKSIQELEHCTKVNLIRHLNRKMNLLKGEEYTSMGIENTLPIVIKFRITANGEYSNLKVYDTQWRIDLQWLTRDARKKWNKGARSHDYLVVGQYVFSSDNSFKIEIPEDESVIESAMNKAQAEDDFLIGTDFMNSGDFENAISRFANHLSFYPINTNAIYNLALCYDRLGDSIKACLYWNYLGDNGDIECKQLVRDYCDFDYSSYEVLENVNVELQQAITIPPEFPGGTESMNSFIESNTQIPQAAKKNKISGIVFVDFIVDTTGRISDCQVSEGLGYGCDVEAIRVVESMPNWIPGKKKGILSDIQVTVPVYFIW